MTQGATKRPKMVCAKCGVQMNFHAEKVVQSAGMADETDRESEFAEVIEEIHTCPGCGGISTRTGRVTDSAPAAG